MSDTNIIAVPRNPSGRTAGRLTEIGDDDLATSVIVAGELRYGCLRKGSARLTEPVEAILAEITLLELKPEVGVHYGEIRRDLEARGLPIGQNDLWIAAHARSAAAILVSDNEDEFRRVEGLHRRELAAALTR